MSGHTPGPWKVVINGNPLCAGVVAVIEHSPDRLLTVEEDHYGGPWCARGTWDANARLIAAAPDLLEALKRMSAHWLGDANAEMRDAFIRDYPESAIADTVAAIAKAEGR